MHRDSAGLSGPTKVSKPNSPSFVKRVHRHAPATVQPLDPRLLLVAPETLNDPFGTVYGDGNDLIIDATGTLHRVWRDLEDNYLYYASRLPNHVWTNPVLIDSTPVGGHMSLKVDPVTRLPAVAYYDRLNRNLKYATKLSGQWSVQPIDAPGDVGDFPSLLITPTGKQYITYYDRTNKDLKLAFQFFPGFWTSTVIDPGTGGADVGGYSSIMFGPRSSLMVAYSDNSNGQLRLATLANGASTWQLTVIDSGMPGGVRDIHLTSGPAGVPMVVYHDAHFKRLKTAAQVVPGQWLKWQLPPGHNGEYASLFVSESTPYVLHFDRQRGWSEVVWLGEPDIRPTRVVALGGEHLKAITHPSGQLIFNRQDPLTGQLRTSTTHFVHTPSNDPAQRIVHWEIIGGATNDVSKRRVGWDIDTIGWQGYVNTRVATLRNLGMRRMFLHNPFGTLPDEVFQFDQYIHAQQAGLTWLTEGFAQAWKPITDSGIEVIAYIGMLRDDPDFNVLTNLHDYMDRVKRSIQPLVDAGMSIGLDSIVGSNVYSREYMVAEMLRQSGISVFNENRPPAIYTHWHSFNGVYHDDGFIGSQPHIDPTGHWAAPNSMLTGELLRWVRPEQGPSSTQLDWVAQAIMKILREGNTAATNIAALRSAGYTFAQLMPRGEGKQVRVTETQSNPTLPPVSARGPGGSSSSDPSRVFSSVLLDFDSA